MSPENGDYSRAIPSHDLDLFEDVDAPAAPAPAAKSSASAPVTSGIVVIDPDPAPDPEPYFESALNLARDATPADEPVWAPAEIPAPALATSGRLYRSSGATGPLAATATVALDRTHDAPRGGSISRSGTAAAPLGQGSVRVYAPSGEPAEVIRHGTSAPAWLAPAPLEDHAHELSHAARPSLLGRPTFSRGTSRTTTRVGDGLLLATDGLTLIGELALTLGAAVLGALIDVTLGSGLGLMLPLLWFVAAIAGAWLIRPGERVMAVGVPPLTFAGAALVIGQLSLPAGHHLLTREALLIFNTLSSAFIWLLVTIIGCVAVVIFRSRLSGSPEVTP